MSSVLRVRGTGPAFGPVTKSPSSAEPASSLSSSRTSLMELPTELHIAISRYLIYPDALSLKHTNRHFYNLVFTGVALKVDWLVERRSLHLECPNDRRCDLGSDLRFCRGSVPLLMKRRREHMECESRPGLGCLVYGTKTCSRRKRYVTSRWQRWLEAKLTIELRWLLLALAAVLCSWTWLSLST